MNKEEAIKWLRHCAESDCEDCVYENQPIEWCSAKMKECVDVVEETLSVEPTDLISRANAIKAVANAIWYYPNKCYKNLNDFDMAEALAKDALSALPSAETHNVCSDLISRAVALEQIAQAECGLHYEDCKTDNCTCDCIWRILNIPPADVPTKCIAQINIDTDEIVKRIKDEYKIVDRLSGEWIIRENGNNECSLCGRERQDGWDYFCGYCGADMRGGVK